MSIVKTEAFVLKSFKYGETSKIVTLFTKDFGKINAIVKGARNYKSKLCGTLETMNYINVIIYVKENRELQLVTGAEYKNSFSSIITDFDKLETAYRIIEILNRSLTGSEINQPVFKLLLETYSKLNTSIKNFSCYLLYFQIRLTKIMGLDPDLSEINSDNETFFDKKEFYFNKTMLYPLQLISQNKIENIEHIDIDQKSLSGLIHRYDKYLSHHTHGYRNYKTAKVFEEINIS